MNDAVRLVEVGARDGLQNEARTLAPAVRAELIGRLVEAGLRHIEAGAFVSPRWVPQMADTDQVLARLPKRADVAYSVLVPNERGVAAALAAGADEVAVFTAASEAFNQRNINCSIAESLARFEPVLEQAKAQGIPVRGYVSCVLGCPYQGHVPVEQVVRTASALARLGCHEISLGDTIGAGVPSAVRELLAACATALPLERLAVHFHDTRGMAVANCLAALEQGVRVFDSSVSGLGGCPYSPGATGNVASEELVYLFEGLGLNTGVDLDRLVAAGAFVDGQLGRATQSRVARAHHANNAANTTINSEST
tara:strand:- start:12110 stop:13039 length:930 start_codon:yes stop_codon:yes gene_type:complete